jgi:hypothetical protein
MLRPARYSCSVVTSAHSACRRQAHLWACGQLPAPLHQPPALAGILRLRVLLVPAAECVSTRPAQPVEGSRQHSCTGTKTAAWRRLFSDDTHCSMQAGLILSRQVDTKHPKSEAAQQHTSSPQAVPPHLGAPSDASWDTLADLGRPSTPQLSSECCAWLPLAEASPAWLLRRRPPGTSAAPGARGDSATAAAPPCLPLPPAPPPR